jgi:hypothetical protein
LELLKNRFNKKKGGYVMTKPKEVIRLFRIPDADSIQVSWVFYNLFLKDSAEFIKLDSAFAGRAFSDGWLASIHAAEQLTGDETIQNELQILTEAVKTEMEAGRTHFQK